MPRQLSFDFNPMDPAPQWIEDLIAEMNRQDLLNAQQAGDDLIVVVYQPVDPLDRLIERITRQAQTN